MKYFFDHIHEINGRIGAAKHTAFFSDYDGTMTPIVQSPDLAKLSMETKDLLLRLANNPAMTVGIISGRGLSDVQKHVGIPNIFYVGSHGYEIALPDGTLKPVSLDPETILALNEIKKKINILRKAHNKILIEDKGVCLAIHYRNVDSSDEPAIESAVKLAEREHIHSVTLKSGKKVWEFVPNSQVSKGTAVEVIYNDLPKNTALIYAGDDLTDEDAFEFVRRKSGLTIHVGQSKETLAEFYINESAEFNSILKFFSKELVHGRKS